VIIGSKGQEHDHSVFRRLCHGDDGVLDFDGSITRRDLRPGSGRRWTCRGRWERQERTEYPVMTGSEYPVDLDQVAAVRDPLWGEKS
jgi:hypothetical protein